MAVTGYIGDYGAGKTYNAVRDAWEAKQQGRAVFSNLQGLIDHRVKWSPFAYDDTLRRVGMWEPVNYKTFGQRWSDGVLRTFEEVTRLDNAIFLCDEVEAWFHATNYRDVSPKVMRFLNQQRKRGVDVWWTAPTNGMVYNQLRDTTSMIWRCEKYFSRCVMSCEDLRKGQRDTGRKLGNRVRKLDKSIFDLYDTREIVGSSDGEGYGVGNTDRYGELRPEQLAVLIRLFGPSKVGYYRDEGPYGVKYVSADAESVLARSLAPGDERPLDPFALDDLQHSRRKELRS